MNVLLTGPYGRCGTALIDHLSDCEGYTFTYFNRSDRPSDHPYGGYETIVGDIADRQAVVAATDGCDAMIHLAAYPLVETTWTDVLEPNLIGTYNAFDAAREHEVETVVFASTNHVMGMYERENAPAIYHGGHGMALDHTDPVRPDSFYGVSKAFGEALGRFYSEQYDYPKRVYALRICSVRMPDYDHPYGDAEAGVDDDTWHRQSDVYDEQVARMKAMWQSRRDFAHLVECCLQDDSVTYGIFNGISANDRRWFSLEHARATLGYSPLDNAETWDAPPD